VVILPVLLPINYIGGRGPKYALEFANGRNASDSANVTGLDVLAWGNVRPKDTRRYWAHLILAVLVIVWVCGVFFAELRVYIKVRQDYLTSAEHRLRASATTVLVSAIPQKWLSTEALGGLYDVFPGGIRNIWINRNYDALLDKIKERDSVFHLLESAETELIRTAKKEQRKQLEKEEKAAAKRSKQQALTKQEKEQKLKNENANAERLAQSGGVSTGDPHQVPHTVDDAIEEEQDRERHEVSEKTGRLKIPVVGGGLAAVGQGLGKGLGAAGKVGGTVFDGAFNVGRDLNNELETTNGFMNIDQLSIADDESFDQYGRYRPRGDSPAAPFGAGADEKETGRALDADSPSSSRDPRNGMRLPGNTVRRPTYQHGIDGANDDESNQNFKRWFKFWEPPSGGFASPIPTGYEEGDEFPLTQANSGRSFSKERGQKKSFGAKMKSLIPFLNKDDATRLEYPIAYNLDYKEDATGAAWEKYVKREDRPTHRLARFSWTPGFLPGLPLVNRKVDTIYWCRGELARLNLEIEIDQKHPERFPQMNSAFIQFNHQVAAHMASQAVTHHVPKHMAPRTVEISPEDVIWDNMSIKWWEGWLRSGIVIAFVAGLVILWTFPVAFTASLSQITTLADKYSWLHWLNKIPARVLEALAGVLPALFLSILLALVPVILNFAATLQGVQTGVQKQKSVQRFYFAFLFVQVFLVVSISGGALAAVSSVENITSVPETLATQLPKAANYFFSYMILQALSVSSGTLLQLFTLICWFVLPKIFDNTARQKWKRNTSLPNVSWGTYFPVYTNFACIALIYSVVAPIIIIFAIITFSLFWLANRYNMLYVSRFQLDTGGLLYPTAINQTFTGLYVMELCLVGLFFLVRDEQGNSACIPQAIIMIVAIVLTLLYQVLLNYSFGPLFEHLPITFEDEAVLRDEAFERAQARRLGLVDEDETPTLPQHDGPGIEMSDLKKTTTRSKLTKFNPVNMAQEAGSWAVRSGRTFRSKTLGHGSGNDTNEEGVSPATRIMRNRRRHRDIEAQKKIADALYGGYHDEIEDLTPEERDMLVKHAFQHYALRARRPTIWIPQDDIGVSNDEIKRTRDFAGANIWISNIGAALDGKNRVVYGRNPPDFSEVDLINL